MAQATHLSRSARTRMGLTLLVVDTAALACAATAILLAHRWHPGAVLALVVAALVCARASDLYAWRFGLSVLDDLPRLLLAATVGTAAAAAMPWWPPHAGAEHLAAATLALGALVVGRALAYTVVRRGRYRGRHRARAVLVGRGALAARVAAVLGEHPEYGLEVRGAVGPRHGGPAPVVARGAGERPVPDLGETCELPAVLRSVRASVVVVACDGEEPAGLGAALRACQQDGAVVYAVPRLAVSTGLRPRGAEQVWGVPLVRQSGPSARGSAIRIKRVLDVGFAAVALLVLWPVMLAVAAAVRLESGPGVLFCQERVGRDGHLFTLYKFRSLRPASAHEQATTWDVTDDPRVGPVGSFIRRTSLDELPQLWNVLRGHMSLVGPRPERPHFVEHFSGSIPRYRERHRVPVGLTGWAQVHGLRGPTSVSDRVVFDNGYIDGWSLWIDAKILLRTVEHLLGGGPAPSLVVPATIVLPVAPTVLVGPDLPPVVPLLPLPVAPAAIVVPAEPVVASEPAPAGGVLSSGPR